MSKHSGITELIETGRIEEASVLLSECMEEEGFNDTLAILAASLNAAVGDLEHYLSNVEAGLKINPANYELHLMKGNYYIDSDVMKAFDEFESALSHCKHQTGPDSGDYAYILDVLSVFKSEKSKDIKTLTKELPILIYKSEEICYGILNHFADCMAKELKSLGEKIEIIDASEEDPTEFLPKLCGRRFKAILGVQTYLFSVSFNDGRIAHDHIFGPKFNMLFDHPACMYRHFTKSPIDFCVLTHDRNYEEFIRRYYPEIADVCILPPAGEESKGSFDKKYDFTFMGTYHDPARWKAETDMLDKTYSGKASLLAELMTEQPDRTYEECVREILGEEAKAEDFFELKATYFYVMSLYREQILKALLESDIPLDVFGDSWRESKWSSYPSLTVHNEVTPAESLDIYASSKMSLNIMSWHKDGRTERVANMMLNRCVVVTDECRYLKEEYQDGEDIVLFNLKEVDRLPSKIKGILSNKDKLNDMSQKALVKASQTDIWSLRAKQFAKLVNDR